MGFGSKIKRAFGFAPDEDNDFDDILSATSSTHTDASDTTESTGNSTGSERMLQDADSEAPLTEDPQLTASIFETVVDTFNQALPSFLRESVDPKSQREYLYSMLDKSVREHLALVQQRASRHSEAQWQQRQTSLRVEVETYKEKLRQLEEKQNEARQAQLSAERQKRALSERVHDLESKVLRLEADAEQTELEKKSLVNKLKVANVHDEDNEALRAEIESLRAKLKESENAANSPDNTPASVQEKVVEKTVEVIKTVDNPETERLLAEAITENAKLKTAAARIKTDHEKELSEAYSVAKELEAKLHMATMNAKELQQELDHANEELRMAEEIQEALSRFEEIKQRQEERISTLKDENEKLRRSAEESERQLRDAVEQVDILNKGIAERDQTISRLETTPGTDYTEKEPVVQTPDTDNLDIQDGLELQDEPSPVVEADNIIAASAATILFDDVLDDTAWVTEPTPVQEHSKVQEEFGYRPPKKRPAPPADDATRQLSLF